MSLVSVKDLGLAYGSKVLFDEACFAIGPRDRVGLVGANGTGKSSLMKILAGALQPDGGEVRFARRARAGYLPQEIAALPEGTLVDSVVHSVPGRGELTLERDAIQQALERADGEEEQLECAQSLADVQEALDDFEERFGRHRAERILEGLGFRREQFEGPTAALSGGWRMRAALAGLLLQDPDLLLLDEPTNHLDVPTLTWFDDFLRRSRKALVLISHDRDFLNRQIGRVLSLEVEGLRSYPGNYDAYKKQRAEERVRLEAEAARQQARREELESFIERFGAKATKARQAQSRVKMLERMEAVEVREDRETVHFRFPDAPRSGRDVVTLEGVRKAYGAHVVYGGLDARVERGQRIAVIGANGAGKTTLLKLVAGELSPDAGEIRLGHNVSVGYYAQHHADTLDARSTVIDEIRRLVPDRPESHVRSILGAFLFHRDEVDKKIGVLSGGERARVALAKLLLVPSNLLLMDEPTNHLDLESSEMLIEALGGYGGTLLFVSHNRSFVNQLATCVWDVRDGAAISYPGNLDEYLYHQAQLAEAAPQQGSDAPRELRPAMTERERKRLEAEERQRRSAVEGPIKREIAELEARIAALEEALKADEASLADPKLYDDFARAKPLLDAHRERKAELEKLYAQWEDAGQRLAAAAGAA